MYRISLNNLDKFLASLASDYDVFLPVKETGRACYKKYPQPLANAAIGEVRVFEPLKAFFFRAREVAARDFSREVFLPAKPFCIVGVKACDLKGFSVYDHVFKNHDYPDPAYNKFREENLIISADCTFALETCFCLALEVKPYPQKDFDINLSRIEDNFFVEAGSKKGRALIDGHRELFEEAANLLKDARQKIRTEVTRQVEKNIDENKIPQQDSYRDVIEKKYKSNIWQDEAKTCVECGACNTICPTCHCFLLYDQKDEKNNLARLRIWDSCLIKDFARVAGGANPRGKLWMRLRNRFEKKFDYFPKVAGIYACTGCGRCILACPAKIDIRRVLKNLVNHE